MIETIQGDIRNWAHDDRYHALICDPPYELGFMNRKWDASGISFDPKTWKHLKQFLYPGAFGFAFASSRGWHRMAMAIEQAGFIIHPSVFGWGFASGFPKATRLKDQNLDNYRYGLQALKPALEPIILFQKPYEGKTAPSILEYGAGLLDVASSRIGAEPIKTSGRSDSEYRNSHSLGAGWTGEVEEEIRIGRWPANLVLIHSPECNSDRCEDDCVAKALDRQSGHTKSSGSNKLESAPNYKNKVYGRGMGGAVSADNQHDDEGGASRFFLEALWSYITYERLMMADRLFYTAKVGRRERDAGLGNTPLSTTDDGRHKTIDNPYQRGKTTRHNPHPTLKPISLTKWLATLLLPPERFAPRKLLVPFAGAGSEMIGAMLAGWDHITGIELIEENVIIINSRIEWWSMISNQLGTTDIERIMEYAPAASSQPKSKDFSDLPLFRNREK